MSKVNEWKLAQKIQASGQRGVIIGIVIAILFITAVVLAILKIHWLKKTFGCLHCDLDELGDDFVDVDCDDDGCCYTSEKDFV